MRPLALTLQNFLSFRDASVDLRDLHGLVLLSGEHRDSRTADSNGAGKSALIDGLCWALYGKIARPRAKAEDVVRRAAGGDCMVRITFRDAHDREVEVVRHRKHSKHRDAVLLSIDGHDARGTSVAETQRRIDQIVGLDHETFTGSTIFTQNPLRGRFAELGDDERKRLLESILGVEVLSRARELARKDLKARELELERAEAAARALREQIGWIEAQLAENAGCAADWERTRDVRLEALRRRQEEARLRLAAVEPADPAPAHEAPADALARAVTDLETARAAARREDAEAERLVTRARTELASARALLDRMKTDVARFDALGDRCPVCTQPIVADVREAHLAGIEAEMATSAQRALDLKGQIASLESARTSAAAAWDARRRTLEGTVADLRTRVEAARALDAARVARARERAAIERQVQELEEELAAARREANPFTAIVERSRVELAEKKVALAAAEKSAEERRCEIERLGFWDRGFGPRGLKSYLLDAVLPILNERARVHGDLLAGGELTVQFSTVVEKDDGLEDRFVVKVLHRNGVDSHGLLSGGEKQRVNLIINLALQDLVASRAARPLPIAIYDEAFEGLDRTGVELAVRVLGETARSRDLVLVITHQEHLKDLFAHELRVICERGESRVERVR